MGKLNINNVQLARIRSFAQRGNDEAAVIAAILDGVKQLGLTAGAEATNAIPVTVQVQDLDSAAVAGTQDIRVRSIPALGAEFTAFLAETSPLPAVTAGGSGVGKTLTANAVGVLTVDGIDTVLADILLVAGQATVADNGLYTVTTEGTGGAAFVLTRLATFDEASEVLAGTRVKITGGKFLAGKTFVLTTNGAVVVDTTDLIFTDLDGGSVGGITDGGSGSIISGAGSHDVWARTDANGELVLNITNLRAAENLLVFALDDGSTEVLSLTFAA